MGLREIKIYKYILNMKKTIYILVDISLSVSFPKSTLINILNQYIDAHRSDNVSIYFFNHAIDGVFINPHRIRDSDFDFRGRTALYDVLNKIMDSAMWDIFPEFIIFSDWKDTASEKYSEKDTEERIYYKEFIGWSFKIYRHL